MTTMKQRLEEDMKAALRAGDRRRLGTIRLALAAIKQREIDERTSLTDAQVIAVLDKMIRERYESLSYYEAAGREDLIAQESFEIEVLKAYLPRPLDQAEIDALIDQAIAASGALGMRDMGKVMSQLKRELQGRADMSAVSAKVKSRLTSS
jgi:Uncharacterized conserved protein